MWRRGASGVSAGLTAPRAGLSRVPRARVEGALCWQRWAPQRAPRHRPLLAWAPPQDPPGQPGPCPVPLREGSRVGATLLSTRHEGPYQTAGAAGTVWVD